MRLAGALGALGTALLPGVASGFELLGPVWEEGRAPLFAGALEGSELRAAFVDAARDWEASSDFDFLASFDELPACNRDLFGVGPLEDGAEFAARDCNGDFLGDDTLAVTMLESESGALTAVGTIFNEAVDWTIYDGLWDPFEPDFRRVALHELGHWLGLDHEPFAAAIMQAFAGDLFSLQSDDVAGARFLYGPSAPPPPPLTPDVACRSAELRAAGALCRRRLVCRAKAAGHPAKDPLGEKLARCVAASEARFDTRFDAAVAGGGCLYEGPAADARAGLAAAAGAIEDSLLLGADAEAARDAKLREKLLERAAAACAAGFRAEVRFAKTASEDRRARQRASAADRFASAAERAIARAAEEGVAYAGTPPADAASALGVLVDAFAAAAGGD